MMYRHEQHRLPDGYYRGLRIIAFTTCTRYRARLADDDIFHALEQMLLESAGHYGCALPVYLLMPDHLHLLLAGTTDEADALAAMKRFKQRSAFWLAGAYPGIAWQKDFYDHILRRTEDVTRHVNYILENPVRAGIVDNWRAYAYKGSSIYDLDSWDLRL